MKRRYTKSKGSVSEATAFPLLKLGYILPLMSTARFQEEFMPLEPLAELLGHYFNGTREVLYIARWFLRFFEGTLSYGAVATAVPAVTSDASYRDWAKTQDFDSWVETDDRRQVSKVSNELAANQAEFREAVKWLCSPKNLKDTRRNKQFVGYFETHGLKHFNARLCVNEDGVYITPDFVDWIDLFCVLLLSAFVDKLPKEILIKLCPKCEKLFVKTGVYCSDKCRRMNFWTPDRHKDYEYVNKLLKFAKRCKLRRDGYSNDDLQRKLAREKTRARIDEIKSRWSAWPQILGKLREIEQLARASATSSLPA